MTFIDAALEVLKRERRPMRAREIADRAVEWSLLSHVGKTPVQTMSACLSTAVSKGNGPFIRVKHGVFGLDILNNDYFETNNKSKPLKNQLDTKKQDNEHSTRENSTRENSTRENSTRENSAIRERDNRSRQWREQRSHDKSDRQALQKTELPKTISSKREPVKKEPVKKEPVKREPVKKELPIIISSKQETIDNIAEYLQNKSHPLDLRTIAKSMGFVTKNGATMIGAMLLSDGFEREQRGLRPRFIKHKNGFVLSGREVSSEILNLEKQVHDSVDKLTQIAQQQILRKLRSLHMQSYVQVVTLFLRYSGFGSMTPIERGGRDEFHLSVEDRRRGGQFKTAVIIRKDAPQAAVSESAITTLRGALHHYDSMRGLIITSGIVSDGAAKEASITNLAPVAFVDGETLAKEMARLGIGVHKRKVNLPVFDDTFFSNLG